jgi:hypothetical protein
MHVIGRSATSRLVSQSPEEYLLALDQHGRGGIRLDFELADVANLGQVVVAVPIPIQMRVAIRTEIGSFFHAFGLDRITALHKISRRTVGASYPLSAGTTEQE